MHGNVQQQLKSHKAAVQWICSFTSRHSGLQVQADRSEVNCRARCSECREAGRVQLKCDGTRWRTGGEVKGNLRMEWVASTLHTTSEHGVSSITTADAHTSAASSRLNWRPWRFKWTRPFGRKTKSGFCACAITFQTQSTVQTFLWQHVRRENKASRVLGGGELEWDKLLASSSGRLMHNEWRISKKPWESKATLCPRTSRSWFITAGRKRLFCLHPNDTHVLHFQYYFLWYFIQRAKHNWRVNKLRPYSVADELMTLEHWWNDTDTGQHKSLEKHLSQCHFVHHKPHSDCWVPCVRMADRPGKRCQSQRLNMKICSFSRKRREI